ncbi:hypothetical protein Tfer_1629 [Thermincola ferriacetica]|uniref:Uncharacterized protein n=2 Tax=Thermincola TaxID=278993 RepID=D5X8N6_THEPJ|nr:hypothetical protein TherJR_2067 [Thermincola potens JR]KNZ69609.1 hypothetical protein Tfer_1629 [Thermincola ferriacetica]
MCKHLYIDKDTGVEYCELLDKPCDETTLAICPLTFEQ